MHGYTGAPRACSAGRSGQAREGVAASVYGYAASVYGYAASVYGYTGTPRADSHAEPPRQPVPDPALRTPKAPPPPPPLPASTTAGRA
jgi:hypothetical protein